MKRKHRACAILPRTADAEPSRRSRSANALIHRATPQGCNWREDGGCAVRAASAAASASRSSFRRLPNFTHFSLTIGRERNQARTESRQVGFSPGSRSKRPPERERNRRRRASRRRKSRHAACRAPCRPHSRRRARRLPRARRPGAAAPTTKPADKERRAGRRQARAGRHLRRLERLPEPVGQEPHLLRARPAQGARRPPTSNAIPATPSFPSGRAKACATKCRSSWASTWRAPAPAADAKDAKDKDKKKDKKKSELVAPTAVIGDATFDLLPKGANLWVKNAAKESELIAEMRKGAKLRDQGHLEEGQRDHRHLFARRLQPGDRPRAEGLPGRLTRADARSFAAKRRLAAFCRSHSSRRPTVNSPNARARIRGLCMKRLAFGAIAAGTPAA